MRPFLHALFQALFQADLVAGQAFEVDLQQGFASKKHLEASRLKVSIIRKYFRDSQPAHNNK